MGTEPNHPQSTRRSTVHAVSSLWSWLTAVAALVGLALIVDASFASSASYDEVAYLRVAARWWRTGDQSEITRMGSPVTFWKLQQVPVLWLLDHQNHGDWIDDPIGHQQELLPFVRLGSAWIWVIAFGVTTAWSRRSYGPRAMALAAWLFALSPNLIAHGALATMELPLIAGTTAMFWLFWRFLETNRWRWFWTAAAMGGLAFSCKFSAILVPPILGVVWWFARWRAGERGFLVLTRRVALPMLGLVLVMLLTDVVVAGFAHLPMSTSHGRHPTIERWFGHSIGAIVGRLYETPLPQDWVGFVTQMHHQASGGPSYLFGERRMMGWWYYYLVAVAVKVPITFWFLAAARLVLGGGRELDPPARKYSSLLPLVFVLYMGMTAAGSPRNYGVRYLLPLAPLAVVWISALGECCNTVSKWPRLLARSAVAVGLGGYLTSVAGIHPYELTYFNALGGGPRGGRRILADSNLDWGQGLKSLSRLQQQRPEFADMTLYYFGDTEPAHYGVKGRTQVINAIDDYSKLPGLDSVKTPYLAVSASLQWGPWGPHGFFQELDGVDPILLTEDTTIAIYRTADLLRIIEARASVRQAGVTR